jgi:hypothetical protein
MDGSESGVSRRDFLRAAGVAGALGVSGSLLGARAALGHNGEEHAASHGAADSGGMVAHGGNGTVGDVDLTRFDPSKFLRQFYWGEERTEGGRTVREYELSAEAVEVEVAPGVMYPAWAYNGQVPGPTLRAREGDLLRVVFKNRDAHPHTIHFHGFHPAGMDGVFELVAPGQEFVYEFSRGSIRVEVKAASKVYSKNKPYLPYARAVRQRPTTWLSRCTPSTGREGHATVTRVQQAQAGGRALEGVLPPPRRLRSSRPPIAALLSVADLGRRARPA